MVIFNTKSNPSHHCITNALCLECGSYCLSNHSKNLLIIKIHQRSPHVKNVRKEEVRFLYCERWSRSTVQPLVDLSRTTANLITIGLADVPKINFETNFMTKKAKYSYRM
jgi:hypothetical protein